VTSLPEENDPWRGPHGDRHQLVNFPDFADEEIGILPDFLHEFPLSHDPALTTIDYDTLFDSDSSDSDNEWDGDEPFVTPGAKITKHPMQPPVHDFNLDDAN
jgi:hypothetical protein